MWNKVLKLAGIVLSVGAMFVLLVAAVATSHDAVLTDVKVAIDYNGENYFFDQEELEASVFDLGYIKDSTKLRDIDPGRLEHVLLNNAFIEGAEVYKELDGTLYIDVTARKPVVRVFNDLGQSAYIDASGLIMPLSNKYSARTPVANGNLSLMLSQHVGQNVKDLQELTQHPDAEIIEEIYRAVTLCSKDPFWSAQFNQYYVNSEGELELIPRVGDHRILVGNSKNLEKKLHKLKLFYEEGLNKTGWNEYEVINLKYANQVVCSKT